MTLTSLFSDSSGRELIARHKTFYDPGVLLLPFFKWCTITTAHPSVGTPLLFQSSFASLPPLVASSPFTMI